MTTRIFRGTLMVLVIFSMGCESDLVNQTNNIPEQNDNISVALDREAAKDAYLAAKETDTGPQTYDKILAEIALEVSGYGGHFFDEEGVLNVWLLDDQDRNAIESILRQHNEAGVFGIDNDLFTDFRSRQGRYDFLQLYNWKAALRRDVLGMKGVTLLDINEAENNITIGLEDLAQKEEILEKVQQMGLPKAAINIIERGFMKQNIRNKRKTLAGGLQIRYIVGSQTATCTLGPVARRNGVKGFIVNSHCSETQFAVDNEKYYQAKPSDRHIATERVNPPTFTGGDCPPGRQCAYADAAFAEWEDRGTWKFGRIYETKWKHPVIGSVDRVGASFIIAIDGVWPIVGDQVNKVGRKTGWTYGTIAETCVEAPVSGTNITMLCQYTAHYGSDEGDSGAPVFKIFSDGINVYLFGIHWGRNDHEGLSAFSNSNLIKDHLGGTVWFRN